MSMGARVKKIVVWSGVAVGVWLAYLIVSLQFLPSVESLKDRRTSMTIRVKDWHGNYRQFVLGPRNRYWTPSASIPAEMKWAVILAEDRNFYRHEGIDVKAIKNAIKYDLEKRSLASGASTITQQVAKNVFLSRQKSMVEEKERIARAAAGLVEEGDHIMLVAGTTTALVAKHLLGKRDIHITETFGRLSNLGQGRLARPRPRLLHRRARAQREQTT